MSQELSRNLAAAGLLLLAAAAVSALGAGLHMWALYRAYGAICGAGAGLLTHCPACPTAAALGLSGLALLGLSRGRRPAARRIAAR